MPGGDVLKIRAAIEACTFTDGKPHAVVLDGVKGAGIREVEETVANHSMVVTPETCDRWLDDLRRELRALEGGEGA